MITQAIRRQAIAALEKDGRVTPDMLVAAASNRKHPLHEDFDWNDKTAAHQARLDTARSILASVRVTVTIEHKRMDCVAYVRDPTLPPNVQGLISTMRLQTDHEMAYAVLIQETDRIKSLVERARQFARVLNLEDELEEILRSLTRLRQVASSKVESAHPSAV